MDKSQQNHRTPAPKSNYVGTLVGESTSTEFRLAVAHETIREQDIIAVDAEIRTADENKRDKIRVWAKVQRIERLNPLFPVESGHELAATKTNPFDTVLSLSREMVTAVCQVLGSEPLEGEQNGKLSQLRYPPQPASSAYMPDSVQITRVVVGSLQDPSKLNRALDVAHLANRKEIDVAVDGHTVVSRHLAILAMTGSGKTWASRRIIEELAKKNYPIVIFDPHGDYTNLSNVKDLNGRVKRYYADFPVFDEDSERVEKVISTLGDELKGAMQNQFEPLFKAAKAFATGERSEIYNRQQWMAEKLSKPDLKILPNLFHVANLAEIAEIALSNGDKTTISSLKDWGWDEIDKCTKQDAKTLKAIKWRARQAGKALHRMEETNKRVAGTAQPLPKDRKQLVSYGGISIVSLAGYTSDFQAALYSIIAEELFLARVQDELRFPVLLVLEEGHNFAPAKAMTPAEQRSIEITKQISQEGRKFGVGLMLISQRPSRLDETTLSQCNSYIIMRMVNPADQSFVRKVIESLGEDDVRLLPDLDTGEALLSGQFINFPVLVRIKPPASKGEREEEDAFKNLDNIKRMQDEEAAKKARTPVYSSR